MNSLTGDYQAVLQLNVSQINGILATLHQRSIIPDASPTLPHAGIIEIGSPGPVQGVEALRFGTWAAQTAKALPVPAGTPTAEARALFMGQMPPGLVPMFEKAWTELDLSVVRPAPTGTVRGKAEFQASSATVSFPAGAVSQVLVQVWVRAIYHPDPGTAPLPAPIHGEVRALYSVRTVTRPGGQRVLRIRPSTDDNQIQFISAAPLPHADVQTLAKHLRAALRTQFVPEDVELPPDFAFTEFKGLGTGSSAAVVLPLQLSAGLPPEGALASVGNHFLGSSDFAIAVGKEYVQRIVDEVATAIQGNLDQKPIEVLGATYRASVSSIGVAWASGSLVLSGTVHLNTDSWLLPNLSVTLSQALTLSLHVPSQTVSLVALGDPQLNLPWFVLALVRDRILSARDAALPVASTELNAQISQGLDKITAALHEFDGSAFVRLTAVEITPDGLVVRGDVRTGGRFEPVVAPVPIDGGKAYSAFHCWIPGGRIERFEWTWAAGEVWASQIESVNEEHTWLCRRPPDLPETTRICLRIHGSVTESNGYVDHNVMAGEVCEPAWHEPFLTVPPDWIEAVVPLWLPRWPELAVNEQVAAYVNALGETRMPGSLTPNTLVHFTGPRLDRQIDVLARALSLTERRPSMLAILVLPPGSFAATGRELEERLGSVRERLAAEIVLTEDLTGGWTRMFAAPEGPSTHLIDARGQFAWRAEGRLDEAELARVLDAHALDAPPPQRRPLRLTVQPGQPAFDLSLVDDHGDRVALRRLRGHRVVLAFWQSWSAPSIRELERLQALAHERNAPRILAINGGEDRSALEAVRRQHGVSLPLYEDPGRRVGARYGVRCWPTTVSINEAGIVSRVQFGLTEGPRP